MRYAIFSDVHANLRAWEQVLEDIRGQEADVLVCLGDVVGYGPKPEEVLHGVREVTGNFVMGNHDAAAAGAMDYSIFNDQARHSIEWTIEALSDESRAFLGEVPLAIEDGEILFVHAEISEPGRFAYIDCEESAKENFAGSSHFITFIGHTHHPNLYQLGAGGEIVELPDRDQRLDPSNRYIVNVGSVGEPRNPEDLRGVYVIYDSETREVEFRKVSFDIDAYRHDLEGTSLEVKPFFLQCYDYQAAESRASAPDASQALAMEAPAAASSLALRSKRAARLRVPGSPLGLPLARDEDRERKKQEQARAKRMVAVATVAGFLVLSLVIWGVGQFQERAASRALLSDLDSAIAEPELVLTESDPASEAGDESGSPAQPVAASPPEPGPSPESIPEDNPASKVDPDSDRPPEMAAAPAPVGGSSPPSPPSPEVKEVPSNVSPTVAWWRMEPDSVGNELVDQAENYSLPAQIPGTRIGGLAPPVIPGNGSQNQSALGLGVWSESAPEGVFELSPDRSFTIEGWVVMGKQVRPVFLAGTRSGEMNEEQGWHLDIRPPSSESPNGQMCFFYDTGPEILQALSEDLPVSDLQPHHFAAVWDHAHSASTGEMRLFFDGEQVAATDVPKAQIPAKQANLFRIGSPENPPRIGLDEVRFTQAALWPRRFLNVTPERMLIAEDFEKPEITGYRVNSAPPGWVGSGVGFGCDKRGLIDEGDGAEFTTPNGRQAYLLAYTNSGLTSGQTAVGEGLAAGSTYRVQFNVGVKKGETATYLVELVAFEPAHDDAARRDVRAQRPGVVLAKATGEATKHDLSQVGRIVFKPDPASPHLGKTLGVRLVRAQGDALYDNIRLLARADELKASPAITATPAPTPAPPATSAGTSPVSPGGTVVAWWRMEPDSTDKTLVDAGKTNSLPMVSPGAQIAAVAPSPVPANGIENEAALSIGVWTEPAPSEIFMLSADRSFTLEGWVVTAKQRGPIFVAGTRSGDANEMQGWHVDIRPRSNQHPNGQMAFFYDTGPEMLQALSEDVTVSDLQPHHFAAVWDHDRSASAGEMRLYLDGDLIASCEVPHAGIPSAPANPFQVGSPTNPPKVGLDEVRFSYVALGPLEFLRAETQSMNKSGKWSDAGNWSGGEPPSGTQTAIVGEGVGAQVDEVPAEFAGDLVLRRASRLRLASGQAITLLPKPPSKLVLHQGAALFFLSQNNSGPTKLQRVELAGSATIWGGRSTSGHHTSRVFAGPVSGPGALVLDGVNNNEFILARPNSFQGGFVAKSTQNQGFRVRAKAADSLGRGQVEISAHATLILDAGEALAPDATLTLSGAKDDRSPAKVILNADNTVAALIFGEEKQAAGTWGGPGSGAEHVHEFFAGPGLLTVSR